MNIKTMFILIRICNSCVLYDIIIDFANLPHKSTGKRGRRNANRSNYI